MRYIIANHLNWTDAWEIYITYLFLDLHLYHLVHHGVRHPNAPYLCHGEYL